MVWTLTFFSKLVVLPDPDFGFKSWIDNGFSMSTVCGGRRWAKTWHLPHPPRKCSPPYFSPPKLVWKVQDLYTAVAIYAWKTHFEWKNKAYYYNALIFHRRSWIFHDINSIHCRARNILQWIPFCKLNIWAFRQDETNHGWYFDFISKSFSNLVRYKQGFGEP